jgi:hypothetical protein
MNTKVYNDIVKSCPYCGYHYWKSVGCPNKCQVVEYGRKPIRVKDDLYNRSKRMESIENE